MLDRSRTPLVLALLALMFGSTGISAQIRETQLPILPERDLLEIDSDLQSRLSLFQEFPGFQTARLFQTPNGGYVLEITIREGDSLVRERRPLDGAALDALREVIRSSLTLSGAAVTQEGRAGLILGHTALGLLYYGWAIPSATDMQDTQGPLATYLLASGASFLIPFMATKSSDVTKAHRTASLWGASRGIWAGWLLGGVVGDGMDEDDLDDLRLGVGVATSVASSILGYKSVDWMNLSHGQAQTMNVMGDFGLFGGVALAAGIGLYDDKAYPDEFESRWEGNLFALGAGVATVAAGRWMSRDDSYTVGDGRALRATGFLGATVGAAAGDLFTDEDDKAVLLGLVAGAGVSTLLGHNFLVNELDFTSGQGLLVLTGQIAGGLVGLGIGVLIDENAESDLFTSAAALGSLAGYGLAYGAFKDEAARAHRNRASGGQGAAEGGVDVQFQLSGLLLPLMNKGGPSSRFTSAPILTIRF